MTIGRKLAKKLKKSRSKALKDNRKSKIRPVGLWRCPLCQQDIGSRVKELIEDHYQKIHPKEWINIKDIEKKITKKKVRPIIFPGGNPGGGKRR